MKISFLITLAGLVAGFGVTSIAQQTGSTPNESTPRATPPPTLQDYDTQILPDRHVIFRLLAPAANEVEVRIGVTSAVNESQGTTTTPRRQTSNGCEPSAVL
jgi:hypothetical protein